MSKDDIKRIMRTGSIMTPGLTRWLIADGGPEAIDFSTPAGKVLMGKMTQEYYREGAAFHPSSLAGCMRAQVFSFIGIPFVNNINAELRNLFLDGQWRHLRWQLMGLESGLLKDVEVPLAALDIRLVGSADGLGDDYLFELKGIYSLWQAKQRNAIPDPKHIFQIHCYFLLLELSGYKIKRCALIYEDKQFQRWEEFVINRDEKIIDDIKRKLAGLNGAVNTRRLPTIQQECSNAKGKTFNDCPYSAICLNTGSYDEAEALTTSVQIGRGSSKPARTERRALRVRRSAAGQG